MSKNILLLGFLFLLGVSLVVIGYIEYETHEHLENPITIEGEITEKGFERELPENTLNKDRVKYYPKIEYYYSYEGKEYIGNNLTSSDFRVYQNDQSAALEKIKTYHIGEKVKVHINPENPTQSYLRETHRHFFKHFMRLGILTILTSIFLLFLNKIYNR